MIFPLTGYWIEYFITEKKLENSKILNLAAYIGGTATETGLDAGFNERDYSYNENGHSDYYTNVSTGDKSTGHPVVSPK